MFSSEHYILHPINAFHLMKRAIKWWPKFNLTSPEKSDFIFGASYGLITIQAYHELDMMKMAQGKNKTIIGLLRAQVKNTAD